MKILYLGSDLKIEGETKNGVFLEADEDEIKAAEQVFAEKVMIADERGIDNIIGMIAFLYPHARKAINSINGPYDLTVKKLKAVKQFLEDNGLL